MSKTEKQFIDGYESYSDAIFRHCYFRVRNRSEAYELMQETFLRAWTYLADGKNIDNLRALLYRIATNLVIDRSRRKTSDSLDALMEQGFQPGEQLRHKFDLHIDADAALKVLEKLDEKYRDVIIWRYVDDLKPKEIALITGESENVISVRLHRGLKQLKELLSYE